MKEELVNLIQQHLPALAAGEMKSYIENAEKDKKELQQFKTSHATLTNDLTQAKADLSKLSSEASAVESKKLQLDSREKELDKRDFNLKLEELKYQLEAEKKSKDSIFQLVQTFVSNPRAIEVTTRNRSYSSATDYDSNGRPIHYPTSSQEFETKEHKEEK
jgi:hypothetical protein